MAKPDLVVSAVVIGEIAKTDSVVNGGVKVELVEPTEKGHCHISTGRCDLCSLIVFHIILK